MPSNINVEDLRQYLVSRLDNTNIMHMEKVERYLNLMILFYDIDKDIKKEGRILITENGAQRFVKPHPGIEQKAKINKELLSIEETFGFHRKLKDQEPEKPVKRRKGGLLDST